MAVMIPDDVQNFCTEGERHFYGLLKTAAKPASKYLAWYLPDIRGRVHRLFWVYRDTSAITDFARKFLNEKEEEKTEHRPPQMELFQNFLSSAGTAPEIRQYQDLDELIGNVARQINHLHHDENYPLSEIAIIYTRKLPGSLTGVHFHHLMTNVLEKYGIYCNWIAEDYRAKRSYDVTTQSVTISTIHSVKGFDYACVFVIGLDWLQGDRWTEEQIRNLTYVAITRARERLFIPHISLLAGPMK